MTSPDNRSPITGKPLCSIRFLGGKSWIQVSTSPIFSMVSVCFWRMSFLTLAWTSCWVCRLRMWSCVRSKNQAIAILNTKCDPSLWRVLFQSFVVFISSVCFWEFPGDPSHPTPSPGPHPTSVSATVRSKSLRTTATWTVIKSVIVAMVISHGVTTAWLNSLESSWHLQMGCLQHFGFGVAGCHSPQLSTTSRHARPCQKNDPLSGRSMSLVEAITQGVLRGMEALLQ